MEPRHDLIAEALWLLADPDGYKNKIKDQGGKQAVEKTVRQLKTEESRKLSSSTMNDEDEERRRPAAKQTQQRTIPRTNNLFKRF